ncbi:MAG: flavodoxin family protein [Bacteroidetes bacterium]|nr:flavodoxin family protein [Bacteroidota bacterium]
MKKILIIYYSQTGQLKQITDSIFENFQGESIELDYYEIKPLRDFPFPWPSDEFFDTMPESVKGIPMKLFLDDFNPEKDYDLVVIAYQVWYLSLSIPVNSFLLSEKARKFLKGKNVLTILGVRNMWVYAHETMKSYLKEYGANHIGNIVLIDKTNNLVSVATIIKWLMYGKKGPYRLLPEAGVSKKDIQESSKLANPIKSALTSDNYTNLQNDLLKLNAVPVCYHVMKIEKNALRIFHKFASGILKKGQAGDKKRIFRVRFFKYYLLLAIYLLFPIASLVFMIKKALFPKTAKKDINYFQGV